MTIKQPPAFTICIADTEWLLAVQLKYSVPSLNVQVSTFFTGQTNRQVDRQTDRQVDRQTDRQVDRQVDTDRQADKPGRMKSCLPQLRVLTNSNNSKAVLSVFVT